MGRSEWQAVLNLRLHNEVPLHYLQTVMTSFWGQFLVHGVNILPERESQSCLSGERTADHLDSFVRSE